MAIVLSRIDNRLLHGIVAVQWAPICGCNRIMVIDDEVANDFQKKEMMKFGRPSGINLSIIDLKTALNNFASHKYDDQKVFIVTKSPQILYEISQIEVLEKVNIGGTVKIEDGVVLSTRAMASKTDMDAYNALLKQGTDIFIQYTPSDKAVSFESATR